jgi:hypothetical protein
MEPHILTNRRQKHAEINSVDADDYSADWNKVQHGDVLFYIVLSLLPFLLCIKARTPITQVFLHCSNVSVVDDTSFVPLDQI